MSPHGHLEFERTRELLRRELPPAPARVLDVGGGTGVHAQWLARDGDRVHLVDVVEGHVEQAALVRGVTASVGDARHLEQPTGGANVVLLLGPLYHLIDAADRAAALGEASRVVRPGGLVVVAAISRYAGLLDLATLGRLDAPTEQLLHETIQTGVHDPRLGFTIAHFTALRNSPKSSPTPARLTSTCSVWRDRSDRPWICTVWEHFDEFLPSALACARVLERDPALQAASAHLLAFGRATGRELPPPQ